MSGGTVQQAESDVASSNQGAPKHFDDKCFHATKVFKRFPLSGVTRSEPRRASAWPVADSGAANPSTK
ncbi:MAG: hypothetical protein COW02_10375 [Comamonadaceae bacterium CG12_big_fil_rev_8_21_14_0_65_59_15]|nr:MAG: hypothetical protein COW02_10375 [Comamonadaceae bacterium CG12_big_fil_rev_8_21_14_0_65_59_15]